MLKVTSTTEYTAPNPVYSVSSHTIKVNVENAIEAPAEQQTFLPLGLDYSNEVTGELINTKKIKSDVVCPKLSLQNELKTAADDKARQHLIEYYSVPQTQRSLNLFKKLDSEAPPKDITVVLHPEGFEFGDNVIIQLFSQRSTGRDWNSRRTDITIYKSKGELKIVESSRRRELTYEEERAFCESGILPDNPQNNLKGFDEVEGELQPMIQAALAAFRDNLGIFRETAQALFYEEAVALRSIYERGEDAGVESPSLEQCEEFIARQRAGNNFVSAFAGRQRGA